MRLGQDPAGGEKVVDATFEEIYQAFKREEKVTIRNFGTFYLDVRASGCGRCLAGRPPIPASFDRPNASDLRGLIWPASAPNPPHLAAGMGYPRPCWPLIPPFFLRFR